MGRLSRLQRFNRMSEAELARKVAESDLTKMLVTAAFGGMVNYAQLAPDGRALKPGEREDAVEQLETGAIAIVTAERERKLVEGLPPAVPIAETLTLLRVLQQGLIFALSENPDVRARAIDAPTAGAYMRLAEAPWKSYMEARDRGED